MDTLKCYEMLLLCTSALWFPVSGFDWLFAIGVHLSTPCIPRRTAMCLQFTGRELAQRWLSSGWSTFSKPGCKKTFWWYTDNFQEATKICAVDSRSLPRSGKIMSAKSLSIIFSSHSHLMLFHVNLGSIVNLSLIFPDSSYPSLLASSVYLLFIVLLLSF